MSSTSHDPERELLRHTLATLAYRGGKAVRDCPEEAAAFAAGPTTRTPLQILGHINDLLDWGLSIAEGRQAWKNTESLDWDGQVARFFAGLKAFDAFLASEAPLAAPASRLFQGPVADALTHVGQIALLRRLAGAPVRGENYYKADVAAGRVGAEQSPPRVEFD
jgi:hypothetical protein